jgi:soluble lytic murein transglycosylase-like protein
MKVGELFVKLGFQADERKAKEFDKTIGRLRGNLAGVAVVATASMYAINKFVDSSVRGAVALTNLANQTGLSAKALQQFQYSANLANIALSTDEAGSAIATLTQRLEELKITGAGSAGFFYNGISNAQSKNAIEVFEELRNNLEGVSDAQAMWKISQLGLPASMLPVLRLSKQQAEVNKALGKQFERSPQVIAANKRIGETLNTLTQKFLLFKDNIVAKIQPFFDHLGKTFDTIASSIQNINKSWGDFGVGMMALIPFFALLTKAITPLTATLAAFLLLLDDIATYKRGGKSAIGSLLEIDFGNMRRKYISEPISDWMDKNTGANQEYHDLMDRRAKGKNSPKGKSSIQPYLKDFFAIEDENGLPRGTLEAIARTENADLATNTTSPAGAEGLFQIMPDMQNRLGVQDPFDPIQSARGAGKLLGDLYRKSGGDMALVTAKYNRGEPRFNKYGYKNKDGSINKEVSQYYPRFQRNFENAQKSINITNNNNIAVDNPDDVKRIAEQMTQFQINKDVQFQNNGSAY